MVGAIAARQALEAGDEADSIFECSRRGRISALAHCGSYGFQICAHRAQEVSGGGTVRTRVEHHDVDPESEESLSSLRQRRGLPQHETSRVGFAQPREVLPRAGVGKPIRLPGKRLQIEIQNEYLVAWVDGELRAVAPDIITLLDEQTGEAIHTERMRYGQRLVAVAIPC